jgi:hypothetical protein
MMPVLRACETRRIGPSDNSFGGLEVIDSNLGRRERTNKLNAYDAKSKYKAVLHERYIDTTVPHNSASPPYHLSILLHGGPPASRSQSTHGSPFGNPSDSSATTRLSSFSTARQPRHLRSRSSFPFPPAAHHEIVSFAVPARRD